MEDMENMEISTGSMCSMVDSESRLHVLHG